MGNITFTVPMKNSGDLNFSYSGLKTAALYKTKELREAGKPDKVWVYDFCRGFLDTIIDSLKSSALSFIVFFFIGLQEVKKTAIKIVKIKLNLCFNIGKKLFSSKLFNKQHFSCFRKNR